MIRHILLLSSVSLAGLTCDAWSKPQASPLAEKSQLGTNPVLFAVPDQPNTNLLVQWSRGDRLILTPNESYFPKLGLVCIGKGIVPSIPALNGKQSYQAITDWDPSDKAAWGVWLKQSGPAKVRVVMSGEQAKSGFALRIEGKVYPFHPQKSPHTKPQQVAEITHAFTRPGQHVIEVECTQATEKSPQLHWLEVSGKASQGAGVIRTRWRPAAAHAKFMSTQLVTGSRMWIMEMDAVPGALSFYAPVTTPFGYYGSTWNADGTVGKSMNFSLWSYGRGQDEPAVEKLSHLLAIGSPSATFSGFGHEGTGVKIRKFDALLGRQGQKQAFALRVEPSKPYDTYYTYYYATDLKQWKLYGVGRKLARKRPLTHLTPGSFVEVPGPPKKQRTGPLTRRMRYRGWISSDGKTWHQLDRMSNGNIDKKTGFTHTRRGVKNGWFFLQTGGWSTVKPTSTDAIALEGKTDPTPEFLHPEKVSQLLTTPSAITVTRAIRKGKMLHLEYTIKNLGDTPSVTLYHGAKEGLTIAKKWSHQTSLPTPKEGSNKVEVKIATPSNSSMCLRLMLKNNHGQFFTFQTTKIE